MDDLILLAKGIYDSTAKAYPSNSLVVRDGRIADIGDGAQITQKYAGAKVVHLPDAYILPGLINTHVHLEFDCTADARVHYLSESRESRFLRAALNANQALRSGVTTVRDAGSSNAALELLSPRVAPLLPLPRLRMAGAPVTVTSGHLNFLGCEADSIDELVKAVRHHKKIGCTDLKLVVTGGQMTPGSGPDRASYTTEEIRAVTQEADHLGMPTFAHCLTTEGFVNCMRGGIVSIEHGACFVRNQDNGLLERVYDPEAMEEFRGSGRFFANAIAAGYHSMDHCRFRPELQNAREAFLLKQEQRECEIFSEYVQLGLVPVLGTDAGVANTYFDETWLELEIMVERCGLSNAEAIATGTTYAAACMHLEQETGKLEQGLSADLLVLDTDPLRDIHAFRQVKQVMLQGNWIE